MSLAIIPPEAALSLTTIGIFHTLFGLLALGCAIYMLVKYRHLDVKHRVGKIYILATAITAATALGIFNHGGFNQAHALAILTLLALLAAIILSYFKIFGKLTPYFQLTAMSSTLLFHMLPTATEILTRLPVDDPLVKSFDAPLLHKTFLVILLLFVVLLVWQLLWLKRKNIYTL